MNVYQNTIVIQTPTVPTFKDHLNARANMDIKEMVFIVKVGKNYTLKLKCKRQFLLEKCFFSY